MYRTRSCVWTNEIQHGIQKIPVFAHVERYGALADLQMAEELRNLGAWITVNADAVLGLEGMGPKKYCKKMLKAECVDAIASDSHGIKNRANHMGSWLIPGIFSIVIGIAGGIFGSCAGLLFGGLGQKSCRKLQFMCTTTILRITRLQSQEKPELLFVMNISRERET